MKKNTNPTTPPLSINFLPSYLREISEKYVYTRNLLLAEFRCNYVNLCGGGNIFIYFVPTPKMSRYTKNRNTNVIVITKTDY